MSAFRTRPFRTAILSSQSHAFFKIRDISRLPCRTRYHSPVADAYSPNSMYSPTTGSATMGAFRPTRTSVCVIYRCSPFGHTYYMYVLRLAYCHQGGKGSVFLKQLGGQGSYKRFNFKSISLKKRTYYHELRVRISGRYELITTAVPSMSPNDSHPTIGNFSRTRVCIQTHQSARVRVLACMADPWTY